MKRAGKVNDSMNVVEVSEVSKSFKGIKVVDSVSFSIGRNGSYSNHGEG